MILRDYCKLQNDETEVWDQQIDISCPYYNYCGDNSYRNNRENHYLFLMENWLLNLDVSHKNGYSCCVDVFKEIKENWGHLVNCMQESGTYNFDFSSPDLLDDDEAIAEYVEDVFTCLSQGIYSFAKDFCFFMGLEDYHISELADLVERKKMPVIKIENYPDDDDLYFYEITDLSIDISQGTGNVIFRYFYIPSLDIVASYVDF